MRPRQTIDQRTYQTLHVIRICTRFDVKVGVTGGNIVTALPSRVLTLGAVADGQAGRAGRDGA
jgi:hypothetical protein